MWTGFVSEDVVVEGSSEDGNEPPVPSGFGEI
jgi:hypothetical protein